MVLASCGGNPTQPSGIFGIVLVNGGKYVASPPSLPAGFGSGSQGGPYHKCKVQVTAASGPKDGEVVATVKPDTQALFRVDLPPGNYLLRALLPLHNRSFAQPTEVTVRADQRTRAIVFVRGL